MKQGFFFLMKNGNISLMKSTYSPVTTRILDIEPLNVNTKLFTFDVSTGAQPGQFINLWLPYVDEKPFSVAYDNGNITKLAIAAVGPTTKKIYDMVPGDRLGIRGPYGNSFTSFGYKRIVLVGGGFGSAPLHFLGTEAQKSGAEVSIIIGARTKDFLMYLDICEASGFRTFSTTDDGSFGEHGRVTGPLKRLLEDGKIDMVQTCGPEKMMEAVAKLCHEFKVPCELSVERYMKCGFGICGHCACDGKIVCRDGCIFHGEEALALADFGQFHRDKEGRKVSY